METENLKPPFADEVPLEDTTLDRDAERLYGALSELIRVYQFRDRDRICCHDLSVTQCYALDAMVERGPLTINDLAARLYLDKSTVSRVVDALGRKGLLAKAPHPEDRRAVQLVASPKGKALQAQIADEIRENEKSLLTDFDPEVRSAMIELIGRLASAAATRVDTTGGTCCCTD